MTRFIVSTLLLSALTLAGCSTDHALIQETPSIALATNYDDDYVENPQLTSDRKLHASGEEARSELGLTRVIVANEIVQVEKIGPIKLTFYNIKKLYLEPDYSMIDYFHVLTERENFDIIKTFVTIENTGKKTVHFSPVSEASTSTQQWNWQQEVYLDGLNTDYKPGEKKSGNIGFILTKDEVPAFLTLTTSDVFNTNKKSIEKAQSLTIKKK